MQVRTENENEKILTSLLREARDEADRLRRRLERYERILLSTRLIMGHELKKPSTAIAGYLDLAEEALGDPARGEEVGEYLRKARAECELLNELNVFFLDLLKLERGGERVVLSRIDLSRLFSEVIGSMPADLDAEVRVEVKIHPGAEEIHFHRDALKMIIANLIENALLYSPEGRRVSVEAEKVMDKRSMGGRELVKIKIVDRGLGIPREYLKKVFDPFVRVNRAGGEGSGLGLTLVKSLVELYGGHVSIRSQEQKGTTVYLTIPVPTCKEESVVLS